MKKIADEKEKIKLCLIAPVPPPYGGIANWTENLRALLEKNHVQYCLLNISPKKRIVEGRSLCNRIASGAIQMVLCRNELVKKIKSGKVNVIHTVTSGQLALFRDILLLKTARKYHIPFIYHIHFGKVPQLIERGGFHWKLMKYGMRLADQVVVIDQKSFTDIKKTIPAANVAYIPNPVNYHLLSLIPRDTKKKVVFVGWCMKEKGIEELLEAWRDTVKNPEWGLDVIGPYDKGYMADIIKKISPGQVNILGELPHEDTMKRLAEASIFVLPSYSEGFPMSVLEAMSLGKAIIATDVGAIPEMLGEECGIVIEKENPKEIAGALKELMENEALRERYGANAREKAKKNYESSIIFERYRSCWNAFRR